MDNTNTSYTVMWCDVLKVTNHSAEQNQLWVDNKDTEEDARPINMWPWNKNHSFYDFFVV